MARIAETARPVLGTAVIERIEPPHSQYLLDAGFRPVDNHNAVEVIHLEDVTECEIVLHGAYPGQVAIHRLASEDANVVKAMKGVRRWGEVRPRGGRKRPRGGSAEGGRAGGGAAQGARLGGLGGGAREDGRSMVDETAGGRGPGGGGGGVRG